MDEAPVHVKTESRPERAKGQPQISRYVRELKEGKTINGRSEDGVALDTSATRRRIDEIVKYYEAVCICGCLF